MMKSYPQNKVNFNRLLFIAITSVLALFYLWLISTNMNYAKVVRYPDKKEEQHILLQGEEFGYTFNVADKLAGDGEIKLTVRKNKIKGMARGIGMLRQCDVDFYTNVSGLLDYTNGEINIVVKGEGDPKRIPLPAKVYFHGPLRGFLKDGKLCFTGEVSIKGALARLVGFKKKEDLSIEIPSPSLARSLQTMQKQKKIAINL